MIAGEYEQALDALAADLAQAPRGPHASRAQLFVGKAALGLGRMDDAKAAFARCVREFPDSLEAHKSRYKLAIIALLSDDETGALIAFRALAETPDGPLAPEAAAMVRFLESE